MGTSVADASYLNVEVCQCFGTAEFLTQHNTDYCHNSVVTLKSFNAGSDAFGSIIYGR